MSWIIPAYLTVICLAIIGRIIWWVAFSQEDEEFLPEDAVFFGVVAWPLVIVIVTIAAICWVLVLPFVFVRNLRLKRKQNASL